MYSIICWLVKNTVKTWLLCRFSHCTCASHLKSVMCMGWCVQQQHTAWWCKKSNKKKNEIPHSDSCIWWNEKRPIKKEMHIRIHTQSNNHTYLHIFCCCWRKKNCAKILRKTFDGVCDACVCVFMCPYAGINV